MIPQSTLYQIAHARTPCCSAPAVVNQPPIGLPECFCAGCLADLHVGYVSHVQRMAVWREWPWGDVRGGRAAVAMQGVVRDFSARLDRLREGMLRFADALAAREGAGVAAQMPLLDLASAWRAAEEVGDALEAAAYLVALRVAVAVGGMT